MRILTSSWACAIPVLLLLLALQHTEAGSKKHFKHNHDKKSNKFNGSNEGKEQEEPEETMMAPEFAVPGREYRFRFDSQTASGYASWISTQRSMSRFQALVNVQFGGVNNNNNNAKEATLRLSECQAGQLNSKPLVDAWNPARIQPIETFESSANFQHDQLEHPVRFSYEKGSIDAIHFSPEEPTWSKNIKKAVLNMLQLQLAKSVVQQQRSPAEKRIDRELAQQTGTIGGKAQNKQNERKQPYYQLQKSFTLNEMTIEGECQCQYTMVPMGGDNGGELVNVTKSINFDNCQSMSDIAYGMQADEEGKQRGEQKQSGGDGQQQDVFAHMTLSELVTDAAEWQNRSGSSMIAKQVLDRSTTIRYVLTNQQQQEKNSKKERQQPGLDSYGIQHVELVSQYVLKSAEPESSQAMQTVAAAKLRFLGAKTVGQKNAKKSTDDNFDAESETLMYNSEMETQEKCFFMFGDDTKDTNERQCPHGASPPNPYNNYPNSAVKVARAIQLLQAVATAQQQQGNVDKQKNDQQQQQRAMNTAENMDELIQTLRYCSEKELAMVTISNALNDISRQFLADALAAAGTRNTLKTLLARIESGEFSDLRAAQLIKTFSRGSGLPAPSDKIADLVLALCKSAKVQNSGVLKQACWLSFGAIVGELNQQQRILRYSAVKTPADMYGMCPAHKMELYTKALLEQFTKNIPAENVYENVIALKAIGNAALDTVPQALIDAITPSDQQQADQSSTKVPPTIRTNAIEALRRIPSQKVHKLLLPVYLNQEENQFVRIIAFSVIIQCQISPSVPMLDQIAFAMSRENNAHVLSYTYTTLKAMADSPAKRHQKIAQHIKTALRLAGVDEHELAQKCRGPPSRFDRSTAYYNLKEQTGVFLEKANVFYGKKAVSSIPNHVFVSLSSLMNGQFTEGKLRLTLCQWNVDKYLQTMLKAGGRMEEGTNDNDGQQQEEEESMKSSYLSHAKEQIKSIWSRLKGTVVSKSEAEEADEQEQEEKKWRTAPAVAVSLRVNNIDTIVMMIGGPGQQQQSPLESLKQMLLMAGVSNAAEYANGVEKPALDVNGILYWQERAAQIGTSVGYQLNIQQKSTVFGQLRADLRKLGSAQFAAELRPAVTYAGVQKMKTWACPVLASGVKRVLAMEAIVPLKAQLTVQPQQQQIKLAMRVPQSSTRVFAFHTLPSTFISESDKYSALSNSNNGNNLHFGERIRSVQNQQLQTYEFNVDKTAFESVHMPLHVQGVLHRPRCLDELKEWAKVLFASENHYQVTFEPRAGSTPRELAHTIHWELFSQHPSAAGSQMRSKLPTLMQKFGRQQQANGNDEQTSISSSSSSSSEEQDERQQSATAHKLANMQSVLNKLIGQRAYKHSVKYTLETVGAEDNKRAEAQLESVCDARFIACDTRAQLKYFDSTSGAAANEPADWEASVQSQHIHTQTLIDLDRMRVYGQQQAAQKRSIGEESSKQHKFKLFIYSAEAEWGTPKAAAGNAAGSNDDQQQIKFYMKAEPSEEMLLLFRDYLRANRSTQISGNDENNNNQQLMMLRKQQLPKNAGRPFVNTYQMVADYKLHAQYPNIFSYGLEMAKTQNYMNTESRVIVNSNGSKPKSIKSNKRFREGQLHARLSIDPVTHQHVNITVRTAAQFVQFRQIELPHPVRPLPIVHVPIAIRPTHSVGQMIQQHIGQPLRTRAECRLDTRRQLLQTFDGIKSPAPISNCWTVLAKHCAANSQQQSDANNAAAAPEFVVLIKSIPGTKQKMLKVISSDMGVLVVEPRSSQGEQDDGQGVEEEQLQLRIISGKGDNKNTIFTSDMSQSQVPEGIEFAHGGTAGKETVIIESEQGHVRVRFNGQTMRIELSGTEYQNGQCGLCGNWDNEANNDQQTMPNGGQAQSVQQFQRAYAIEDEEGEEQQGCTRSALDQFYAQQADKFRAKWSERQAKNGEQNSKQGGQKDEEDEGIEIEPQQQTKVIEYSQQLCFSIRPVKQCPVGSYATTRADNNNGIPAGAGGATEIKKQKVPFTCVQRASLEAKRLKQQARRREAIQLGEYPASFQEIVVVPERCIKY